MGGEQSKHLDEEDLNYISTYTFVPREKVRIHISSFEIQFVQGQLSQVNQVHKDILERHPDGTMNRSETQHI